MNFIDRCLLFFLQFKMAAIFIDNPDYFSIFISNFYCPHFNFTVTFGLISYFNIIKSIAQ